MALEISVVLLSDGPIGDLILEEAEAWTRFGFLRESIWIRPGDCIGAEVRARRVARDGGGESSAPEGTVWLEAALGQERVEKIRLVLANVVAPEGTSGADIRNAATAVLDRLRVVLPPHTEVIKVNALIPSNLDPNTIDVADVDVPLWESCVVVAPEDRPGPQGVDQALRTDRAVAAHALLNIAVLAGFFAGQETGPLDTRSEGSSMERQPPFVRSFARGIVAQSFFPTLAATIFAQRNEWPRPSSSVDGMPTIPAEYPEGLIADALPGVRELRNSELVFKKYASRPRKKQVTVTLLGALRLMFESVVKRLRGLPNRFKARAQQLAGAQAAVAVRLLTGLGSDSVLLPAFRGQGSLMSPDVKSVEGEADRLMRQLGRAQQGEGAFVVPASELWATLRNLSCAFLDGGAVPPPFEAPVKLAQREIICEPGMIVSDPRSNPFRFSDEIVEAPAGRHLAGVTLRATDPLAAVRLQDALNDSGMRYDREVGILGAGVGSAEDTTSSPSDAESDRDVRREAAFELDQWVADQSQTLWWRIGQGIGDELEGAQREFAGARAALEQVMSDAADPSGEERRINRAHRFGLVIGALTSVVIGWLVWRLRAPLYDGWIRSTATTVVVALVLCLVFAVEYLRYCRRMFALQFRLEQRHVTAADLCAEAVHCLQEMKRLARRYQEFMDWNEVVGWLVYGSLAASTADDPEEPASGLEGLTLPAAFRIEKAEIPRERIQRMSEIFRRQMYGPGWLADAYESSVLRARGLLDDRLGLTDPNLDPDNDNSEGAAREHLLIALRDGLAVDRRRALVSERLRAFCEVQESRELLDKAEVHGAFGAENRESTVSESLQRFLAVGEGGVAPQLLRTVAGDPAIARTVAWVPLGEMADEPRIAEMRPVRPVIDTRHPYVAIALLYQETGHIPVEANVLVRLPDPREKSPGPKPSGSFVLD